MTKNKNAIAVLFAAICIGSMGAPTRAADPQWQLINIDMDGSIPAQKQISSMLADKAELRHDENSLRLYANKQGTRKLRAALAELRQKHPDGRWLTFEGSGDFHQTAAFLLESLPASCKPVNVILFDNHPDWFKMPLRYHCGTWGSQALKLPYIERFICIGMNSDDLKGSESVFAPVKDLRSGRVTIYPLKQKSSTMLFHWNSKMAGVKSASLRPWGTSVQYNTMDDLGTGQLADQLAKELAGKKVYITIDKDVLAPEWAISDWDQSQMTLDQLLLFIKKIGATADIVGADVTGEQAPDMIRGAWKRYDGLRIHDHRSEWQHVNAVNEATNLSIVDALTNTKTKTAQSSNAKQQ